ncbi:MAG: hypothetical protein COT39_00640 [Parcubacteria group bacterium CG08_land_8_20_14_0_20_48_21]|nr:MAG: hypothetical protein AUK21_03725 [Parcubacteria group bacterium CG2_30_48_51]PIS33169.1 MAG: hypothetical protein COT39_00640 [Parcubacteria group bacterium CG08_land_8_20_14_0_20_48_21]PIW79412.1 MAG: hypothetical protein COZ99_01165 [Parcubacteria group bacterium CG_4_8_14_3_um_filter_48_16]PIY77672.1 MAG: hypothetical protein COY83_03990 [Parcubacteria group bacterium CG_4_10_14_0_8_um_filter_48_154]PJC40039.1 MAG: hypothetical protein CO043_01020 [Parcubacteria group bacterium CG_4_
MTHRFFSQSNTGMLLTGSFFIFFFVVLGILSVDNAAYAATEVSAHVATQLLTLLAPEQDVVLYTASFLITGTAPPSATVEVYIDGTLDGQATVVGRGNKAYYTYELAQGVESGAHTLSVSIPGIVVYRIDQKFTIQSAVAVPLIRTPGPGLLPDPEPVVSGIVSSYTRVRLLVDNRVLQEIAAEPSAQALTSFVFDRTPPLRVGKHTIVAQAFLDAERASDLSKEVQIEVVPYYPAPTLLTPVVNTQTTIQRPWLQGLAFNDARVYLAVDGKYLGEYAVVNSVSGTAHFSVQMPYALAPGEHILTARAKNAKGSLISPTSRHTFTIAQPQITIGATETSLPTTTLTKKTSLQQQEQNASPETASTLAGTDPAKDPIATSTAGRLEESAPRKYKGMGWWIILAGVVLLLWIWFGGSSSNTDGTAEDVSSDDTTS